LGKYPLDVIWEQNIKKWKRAKCKISEKGRKGKEKEKMGSKRVK
jgi:hypothetical protein